MANNDDTGKAAAKAEKEAAYLEALARLELAVVQTQSWLIETKKKVVVILEGRDAAGKDGAIKALTLRMSARNTRIVALPKPTERETTQWYFQRHAAHLPSGGEFVIFNRSWYNRAGVEPVMGFCTPAQTDAFYRDVVPFESGLVDNEIILIKFFISISRAEQETRLKERMGDPLKALKVSPLDARAGEKWDAYSDALARMLAETHHPDGPWTVVRGDSKKKARLAVMAHIVRTLACPNLTAPLPALDESVAFAFEPSALKDGRFDR
jgi:polyphosphate kinase